MSTFDGEMGRHDKQGMKDEFFQSDQPIRKY